MVDCAGPWKVLVNLGTGKTTDLTFHIFSMIDSGAGWVELSAIASASSKNISKVVENIGYLASQGQRHVATTPALSLCAKNFKNFYPGILSSPNQPQSRTLKLKLLWRECTIP